MYYARGCAFQILFALECIRHCEDFTTNRFQIEVTEEIGFVGFGLADNRDVLDIRKQVSPVNTGFYLTQSLGLVWCLFLRHNAHNFRTQ